MDRNRIEGKLKQLKGSVKEALGKMRFRPAVQASKKVRQWVEQNFAFRIAPKTVAADTT